MSAERPAALAVTVSARVFAEHVARARACATRWGLPFFERRRLQGLELLLGVVAESFLVLGTNGWTLRDARGALQFSPGMAALRIKRLDAGRGEDDVLLRLGEVRPGDVVFDATAGLASDALVTARAVGPTGRVLAVEASLPIWALVSEGLQAMPLGARSAPVELVHGQAIDELRRLGAGSVDCVFFDPMFRRAKRGSESFELMRHHASHQPLTPELLAEARRVARRWVVVKSGRYGRELRELGLEKEPTNPARPVVWARVRGSGAWAGEMARGSASVGP